MLRVRRPLRLTAALAAAAIASPALAACSTSPGAAAIVGDQRISVDRLQTYVRAALTDPKAASQLGSNRAGFTRQVLAHLISDDLIAAAAAAHHVTVTQQDVAAEQASFAQQAGSLAALRQQAAQGGVPAAELPGVLRSDALQAKLADALIANVPVSRQRLRAQYNKNIAQYDQVHAAHILVKSQTLAQQLLKQVRQNPSSFASLAQKYSIDTGSKSQGGDLGFVGRGQTVAPFDRAIFSSKPGSYLLVHSQFGWHVVHVIQRTTKTLQQATPELKASLLSQQQSQLMQSTLASESRSLGVHVSPRYGTWDPAQQTVNPIKEPVSSTQ